MLDARQICACSDKALPLEESQGFDKRPLRKILDGFLRIAPSGRSLLARPVFDLAPSCALGLAKQAKAAAGRCMAFAFILSFTTQSKTVNQQLIYTIRTHLSMNDYKENKKTYNPTFTHCEGDGCKLRKKCLRHDAHIAFTKYSTPGSSGAYYFPRPPFKGKSCSSYVDAKLLTSESAKQKKKKTEKELQNTNP